MRSLASCPSWNDPLSSPLKRIDGDEELISAGVHTKPFFIISFLFLVSRGKFQLGCSSETKEEGFPSRIDKTGR